MKGVALPNYIWNSEVAFYNYLSSLLVQASDKHNI